MKRPCSLLCCAAFRRTRMLFALSLERLELKQYADLWATGQQRKGPDCAGAIQLVRHSISTCLQEPHSWETKPCTTRLPSNKGKATGTRSCLPDENTSWGLCPEAVLKHFGPLHVLMRKQASHFFIALGPAMKSNLLQEVKIPPGFHKDIYGMR